MKESTFGRLLIHLEIQEYGGLKIKDGTNNLWGGQSSYGKVHLSKKQIDEFNKRQKKF